MTESTPSRFDAVHRQLRTAHRAAVAVAIVAFAAIVGLARASHPGTSSPAASTGGGDQVQSNSTVDDGSSQFFFGGGSVSPSSGSSPSVQSGGS